MLDFEMKCLSNLPHYELFPITIALDDTCRFLVSGVFFCIKGNTCIDFLFGNIVTIWAYSEIISLVFIRSMPAHNNISFIEIMIRVIYQCLLPLISFIRFLLSRLVLLRTDKTDNSSSSCLACRSLT